MATGRTGTDGLADDGQSAADLRQFAARARTQQMTRAVGVASDAEDYADDAEIRALRSRKYAEDARTRLESLRNGKVSTP